MAIPLCQPSYRSGVVLVVYKEIFMLAKKSRFTMVLFLFTLGTAYAGDCVLHITRTSCPGKEAESYSKCDGKQSCNQSIPVASALQCASEAKSSCANKRYEITKYKKVTATYDGAPVEAGKDFCIGHPDYPYANKPDCK